MCRHFSEDFGASHARRPVPQRLWPARHVGGGREKAPAAICRKVVEAKLSGSTRSRSGATASRPAASCTSTIAFTERAILDSEIVEPINLGSSEMVTINQLVDIVEDIAGVKLEREYLLAAPKGVAVGTATIR